MVDFTLPPDELHSHVYVEGYTYLLWQICLHTSSALSPLEKDALPIMSPEHVVFLRTPHGINKFGATARYMTPRGTEDHVEMSRVLVDEQDLIMTTVGIGSVRGMYFKMEGGMTPAMPMDIRKLGYDIRRELEVNATWRRERIIRTSTPKYHVKREYWASAQSTVDAHARDVRHHREVLSLEEKVKLPNSAPPIDTERLVEAAREIHRTTWHFNQPLAYVKLIILYCLLS